jgi:hypothetical protein
LAEKDAESSTQSKGKIYENIFLNIQYKFKVLQFHVVQGSYCVETGRSNYLLVVFGVQGLTPSRQKSIYIKLKNS